MRNGSSMEKSTARTADLAALSADGRLGADVFVLPDVRLDDFLSELRSRTFHVSNWVGFDNFIRFFHEPNFLQIMRNTMVISGLNLLFGFPAPIILALLLNEVKSRVFKKTIQSLSYIPYFISWVVVANILFTLLGSDGILNDILTKLGFIEEPLAFMTNGKYFWAILVGSNVWKDMGFSAIIYLSAMAGIDNEQYEAGRVDGLGRFGLVCHITLPGHSLDGRAAVHPGDRRHPECRLRAAIADR